MRIVFWGTAVEDLVDVGQPGVADQQVRFVLLRGARAAEDALAVTGVEGGATPARRTPYWTLATLSTTIGDDDDVPLNGLVSRTYSLILRPGGAP